MTSPCNRGFSQCGIPPYWIPPSFGFEKCSFRWFCAPVPPPGPPMRERIWAASFAPPTGEKTGDFPPVFIQFCVPPAGHKKTPQVCVTHGVAPANGRSVFSYMVTGRRPRLTGCSIRILAFRGLSACQGSPNSSKIVVNEVGLTCLKCPWIQCFQGIIRFRLDFS